MLEIVFSTEFKRDVKRMRKRGVNLSLLEEIMEKLAREIQLDPAQRDHTLMGKFQGHRECHIRPDWLLIYRTSQTKIMFARTGSHSDLFD